MNTSIEGEQGEVTRAFFDAFDQLELQAEDGHAPILIIYANGIGSNVTPESWTVRDIVDRPEFYGKNIGFVPAPEERTLSLVDFDARKLVASVHNPTMCLLTDIRELGN